MIGVCGGKKKVGDVRSDEVMDYKGLAAYLKMAEGTLRHKVMRGEIPFSKIGHSVRFSKKEIDAWLADHRCSPKKKNVNEYASGGDELFAVEGA